MTRACVAPEAATNSTMKAVGASSSTTVPRSPRRNPCSGMSQARNTMSSSGGVMRCLLDRLSHTAGKPSPRKNRAVKRPTGWLVDNSQSRIVACGDARAPVTFRVGTLRASAITSMSASWAAPSTGTGKGTIGDIRGLPPLTEGPSCAPWSDTARMSGLRPSHSRMRAGSRCDRAQETAAARAAYRVEGRPPSARRPTA